MQALSIYFTYGLQCYMPIIILLDQYIMPEADDNRPRGKIYFFWNVMIRLIVTLITCTYISLSLFFFRKKKIPFEKLNYSEIYLRSKSVRAIFFSFSDMLSRTLSFLLAIFPFLFVRQNSTRDGRRRLHRGLNLSSWIDRADRSPSQARYYQSWRIYFGEICSMDSLVSPIEKLSWVREYSSVLIRDGSMDRTFRSIPNKTG